MIIGLSGYIGSGKDTVGQMILDEVGCFAPREDMGAGVRWYKDDSWEIKKFAEKLKQIASLLTGIPREKFEDQAFKESLLGDEWRELVSTFDLIRILGENKEYWENMDKRDTDGVPMWYKWALKAGYTPPFEYEHNRLFKDEDPWKGPFVTVRKFLQRLGTEGIRDGVHKNAWVNALFADYKEGDNWVITDVRFPNEAKAVKDKGGIVVRICRHIDYEHTEGSRHESEIALDSWTFDYTIENRGTLDKLRDKVRRLLDALVVNEKS